MHGDFSRRTFEHVDGYRAVLLQQGRVLLDADWNEQTDIATYHDEVRTVDIVGDSGGPAPAAGATGAAAGPFAIVTAAGRIPNETAWRDLRITPGRYYVGGVLAESSTPPAPGKAPDAAGWPLTDQPHLPRPGLDEPTGRDRIALYLDVWQRQVTFDEDPALLESALGGPDTTTRAQTVWQVRAVPVPAGQTCSDLRLAGVRGPEARRMAAELAAPDPSADPCRITATGGYERLENQLYRVQVHDGAGNGPGPAGTGTFMWSRDNGIVVAKVLDIDVVDAAAGTAVLTVDRTGRDEELSIREGHLLEATSTDRELRGLSGLLATAGAPTGQQVPVTWLDPAGAPGTPNELGAVPIVRRWEGGPLPMTPAATALESGIAVRFPEGGQARTGDYWLVPARTVRLAYGLDQQSGTIEWPPGGRGALQQPPAGPRHEYAPLAVLVRDGQGWSLESDCRQLFPPLTGLVTIDLAGGDGQEAMPGDPLPAPVRVAVRRGEGPVPRARLAAMASHGGSLSTSGPPAPADPAVLRASTGQDGVAALFWLLNPTGPTTQTLTISRVDDHDQPLDVPIVATGRLSVASQVRWDPACQGFAGTRTVQDALTQLARTARLVYLGGDGQEVEQAGDVVPRPVRVAVLDACGPVAGAPVVASAASKITGDGAVAPAKDEAATPSDLPGASETALVKTDSEGVAAFWWRPSFGNMRWSVLEVRRPDAGEPPIRVSAQLDPAGGGRPQTPGIHIVQLAFGNGVPFENDAPAARNWLASGIDVTLDGSALRESVRGKPVCRLLLDLPYPLAAEKSIWSDHPVATRTVELAGFVDVDDRLLSWRPGEDSASWVENQLPIVLDENKWTADLLGRFVIDGWAIVGAKDRDLHVNCHARTLVRGGDGDSGAHTRIVLPTDDEILGGQFVQWFRLDIAPNGGGNRIAVADVVGMTHARAVRELEAAGLVVDVETEPSADVRKGLVIRAEPAAKTELLASSPVTVVVSAGRPG